MWGIGMANSQELAWQAPVYDIVQNIKSDYFHHKYIKYCARYAIVGSAAGIGKPIPECKKEPTHQRSCEAMSERLSSKSSSTLKAVHPLSWVGFNYANVCWTFATVKYQHNI